MKKIFSLTLAAALIAALLTGCSGGGKTDDAGKQLTAEERTELYKSAIEKARSAEDNESLSIITSANDEMASLIFDVLGASSDDMSAFALSVSPMNVKAYGIAVIYPAADKSDQVMETLRGYVDRQKQSFEQYLVDQYEIASNAKLETLEDGTIVLVMCEGQDAVFNSIKGTVEAGKQ